VIPVPRHWDPVFDRKCFILTKAYTHQIQCIYLQLSFLDSSVTRWNDSSPTSYRHEPSYRHGIS
ncbi:MAG: hypothetical protein ACEY3F_01705, partial [Wolbachia sp.]